jgi:hypothetical protein
MPRDFGPKKLKLKRGDVRVKTRGGLTALVWKDRREVYMLINMDPPPAEGNFCDDSSRPMKPHIVEPYKAPLVTWVTRDLCNLHNNIILYFAILRDAELCPEGRHFCRDVLQGELHHQLQTLSPCFFFM